MRANLAKTLDRLTISFFLVLTALPLLAVAGTSSIH